MFKCRVELEVEPYSAGQMIEKILSQAHATAKDGSKLRIVLEVTELESAKVPEPLEVNA